MGSLSRDWEGGTWFRFHMRDFRAEQRLEVGQLPSLFASEQHLRLRHFQKRNDSSDGNYLFVHVCRLLWCNLDLCLRLLRFLLCRLCLFVDVCSPIRLLAIDSIEFVIV